MGNYKLLYYIIIYFMTRLSQSLAVITLLLGLTSTVNSKVLNLYDLDAAMQGEQLFSSLYNTTVEWGLYKPDLYFAAKNRAPHPLSVGMFWYSPPNTTDDLLTRYDFEMENGVIAHYEFNDATCSAR